MEELLKMKEDYIRELIRYYREKGITNDSVPVIDTMVHTTKNLCKIIEGGENKSSGMNSMAGNSYGMNHSYNGYSMDESFARGRGPNAARDAMGRYSSHGDMVGDLTYLMNRTTDENTRRELQDMINRY